MLRADRAGCAPDRALPGAVARARGKRCSAAAVACLLVLAVAAPSSAADKPARKPAASAPAKAARPPAGERETEGRGPRFLDGIVAVVDGDPITLRELKQYGINGAPFLPPEIRGNYQALLDSMIEHRLLKAEFEKHGIVASDAMVDRYIASVLEDSKQTRANLELDIARAGLSWNDYYSRMREEVQRIQLINLQIRSRVNVTDEELERTWETDARFLEDEKLEVGVIFLPTAPGEDRATALERAQKVRKDANRNFEGTAKEMSKGPAASEGGHLGDFKRGTMAAHFEKGLAGLDEGDVSEPIEGPGGYYIVKLIDIKASARLPFDQVKEDLRDKLYEQRLQERYKKWATTDLRKDHRVEILVDDLALIAANATSPPNTPLPGVATPNATSAPLAPEPFPAASATPPAGSATPPAASATPPAASEGTPNAAANPPTEAAQPDSVTR